MDRLWRRPSGRASHGPAATMRALILRQGWTDRLRCMWTWQHAAGRVVLTFASAPPAPSPMPPAYHGISFVALADWPRCIAHFLRHAWRAYMWGSLLVEAKHVTKANGPDKPYCDARKRHAVSIGQSLLGGLHGHGFAAHCGRGRRPNVWRRHATCRASRVSMVHPLARGPSPPELGVSRARRCAPGLAPGLAIRPRLAGPFGARA